MTDPHNPILFILLAGSFFLTSLGPSPAFSQAATGSKSSDLKLKPIDVRLSLLGFEYSKDNELLSDDKQFEALVYPLRDFESANLLKSYEASKDRSEIFHWVGVAGLLTGLAGLLSSPSDQQTPFWVTAIGGAVSFQLGGLFKSDAQAAKFNCVQRYNRFARGEEGILPQGPSDEKSLLNFDNGTVKPTAVPAVKN